MQRLINNLHCFILASWLIIESVYGLMQVAGNANSGHALFSITGHFFNPGPYGGFISMLLAVCVAFFIIEKKECERISWLGWWCSVAIALGIIVLPSSMSRAGWLAFSIVLVLLEIKYKVIRNQCRGKILWLLVIIVIVVMFFTGAFYLKKDSALGRFHIWHMESLSILSSPWRGCGYGHLLRCYGETQHNYFASGNRATWEIRVAGCPEYAFNEYLKAGVEWGIPGLVLAVGIALLLCIILVKNNNPLGYGAVSLAVFSLFSYPLSLWQFQICGSVFLVAAIYELMSPKLRWTQLAILLPLLIWILISNRTVSHKKSDYRLIYQHGYTLFQEGLYDNAIEVLREGAELSCDPMFHNIIGRCYESLGKLTGAEAEYWYAHYMVPGRLYPLVLLQEMYLTQGDTTQANLVMSEIQDIPINPKNPNMQELRNRAEENML